MKKKSVGVRKWQFWKKSVREMKQEVINKNYGRRGLYIKNKIKKIEKKKGINIWMNN